MKTTQPLLIAIFTFLLFGIGKNILLILQA